MLLLLLANDAPFLTCTCAVATLPQYGNFVNARLQPSKKQVKPLRTRGRSVFWSFAALLTTCIGSCHTLTSIALQLLGEVSSRRFAMEPLPVSLRQLPKPGLVGALGQLHCRAAFSDSLQLKKRFKRRLELDATCLNKIACECYSRDGRLVGHGCFPQQRTRVHEAHLSGLSQGSLMQVRSPTDA